MRRLSVDTNALVWHVSAPKRLGRAAARAFRAADAGHAIMLVPAIVAVELSLLRQAGRRTIGVPQLEALMTAQPAFALLPLDLAQAREFALLDSVRDPFDRMIVAAARATGTPLVTADVTIRDSALVEVVWD